MHAAQKSASAIAKAINCWFLSINGCNIHTADAPCCTFKEGQFLTSPCKLSVLLRQKVEQIHVCTVNLYLAELAYCVVVRKDCGGLPNSFTYPCHHGQLSFGHVGLSQNRIKI